MSSMPTEIFAGPRLHPFRHEMERYAERLRRTITRGLGAAA